MLKKNFLFIPLLTLGFTLAGAQDEAFPSATPIGESAPKTVEVVLKKDINPKEVYIGSKEFLPLLTERLSEKFKKSSEAQIKQALRTPKIAHSLNVWQLAHLCDRKTFAEIAQPNETTDTDNLQTGTTNETSSGLAFLSTFVRDPEWLEGFLNSGPVKNPDNALLYLSDLYSLDPEIVKNPIYKKLATATALEYARNDWPRKDCHDRYNYFRRSHEYKRLNPQFDTLDYWDMRIVAGCKNENSWGSVKSLTWFRDNVHLPAEQYCGTAYQVPYRLENYFGDSIHGSDYYRNFAGLYESYPDMARNVGAVCGGLSHYGAFSALANGVVALTMGEPGHCAYAVRVNKTDWSACNSVTPYKRGCHWNFYGPEWSMLLLTQTLMSDLPKIKESGTLRNLGNLQAAAGNIEEARASYFNALREQPLHIEQWRNYLDWEKEQGSLPTKGWVSINESICKYLAPEYPEICLQLLNKQVFPTLLPKMESTSLKLAEVEKFHKLARKMGALKWDAVKHFAETYNSLGEDRRLKDGYMRLLLSNHAQSSDFGGAAMSWCQQKVVGDPVAQKEFFDLVGKMLSKVGTVNKDAMVGLADATIMNAESNDDIEAFQEVGRLMKRRFKDSKLPKYKGYPGEMLSRGGLVKFSSIKPEEERADMWKHWGILEKEGGEYVSGKDPVNPTATVVLKNMVEVSGVVVLGEAIKKDAKKEEKEQTLVVEGSDDGTTWKPIGKTESIDAINRIDGAKPPVRAKHIRITRTGKGNWGLKAIHVFGKRLS